jgi:hypothetical protein
VPEEVMVGLVAVAALARVRAFTAEPVAVNVRRALPFVSRRLVPILGLVSVLFVKV